MANFRIPNYFKEYGVTKTILVFICVLLSGGFVFFIVYPLLDIVSNVCNAVIPWVGCDHVKGFANFAFSITGLLIIPFVGLPWLLKKSYLEISFIIIILLSFVLVGYQFLKRNYYNK